MKSNRGLRITGLAMLALIFLALPLLVIAAPAVVQKRPDRVTIGDGGNAFNLVEAFNISFAGATSGTASSDVTGTYFITATFKSSTADPGKITAAISNGTLTVSTGTATTGTVSVLVFQSPS